MGLTDGDFMNWYNSEITRYRDFEWQVASYSIGLSSAIVLFSKGAETRGTIPPWMAATAVGAFVLLLLVAQVRTHSKLNQFRRRREQLCAGDASHSDPDVRFWRYLLGDLFDRMYLAAFVAFPLAFGLGAVFVLNH